MDEQCEEDSDTGHMHTQHYEEDRDDSQTQRHSGQQKRHREHDTDQHKGKEKKKKKKKQSTQGHHAQPQTPEPSTPPQSLISRIAANIPQKQTHKESHLDDCSVVPTGCIVCQITANNALLHQCTSFEAAKLIVLPNDSISAKDRMAMLGTALQSDIARKFPKDSYTTNKHGGRTYIHWPLGNPHSVVASVTSHFCNMHDTTVPGQGLFVRHYISLVAAEVTASSETQAATPQLDAVTKLMKLLQPST